MTRRAFLTGILSSSDFFPVVLRPKARGRAACRSSSEQEHALRMLATGRSGLGAAVEELRGNRDSRIREVAAYIIGKVGGTEEAGTLLMALRDSSARVRRAAILALQKILYPQAINVQQGDAAVLPPPKTLPIDRDTWCSAIRPLLRDPSPFVRSPAAQILGWLRCTDAVPELEECALDPLEPVRFYACSALRILTGKVTNFIRPSDFVRCNAPYATVIPASSRKGSAQMGPFLRMAFFDRQGKFTFPQGIPACLQTLVSVWWEGANLSFDFHCDDPNTSNDDDDKLTILLQPPDILDVYCVELTPKGVTNQSIRSLKRETMTNFDLEFSADRDHRGWNAKLVIPFRALGRVRPPLGEVWGANVVRVESHNSPGFGPEVSSWTYSYNDSGIHPRLGSVFFAADTDFLVFRPGEANVYTFPFDQYSPEYDLACPIRLEDRTRLGRFVLPDHLARGRNTFGISIEGRPVISAHSRVSLTAYDYLDGSVVGCSTLGLRAGERSTKIIELTTPLHTPSRSVDLELTFWGGIEKHPTYRSTIRNIPLISPPSRLACYPLDLDYISRVKHTGGLNEATRWQIRDLGPMQMSESYPMALVQSPSGILYGGTYPGGRLFSYDPSKGIVKDLGSPRPPCNHLHDLVASPDGRIFGGLYRPEGRLFSYDPAGHNVQDFGVPVPGAFSGSCRVMAWSGGRIYGIQRAHLFYADAATGRVVDKGNFFKDGARYLPTQIASDAMGNLLGLASGCFFRYLPDSDEVLISSDTRFHGWLLNSPDRRVYAFNPDGRMFLWEPEQDRLNLIALYPKLAPRNESRPEEGPYGPVEIALSDSGKIFLARSGVDDPENSSLLIFEPGANKPISLGNPLPGSHFLTALTVASNNHVYGLATKVVYGLARTPVRLYSVVPTQ